MTTELRGSLRLPIGPAPWPALPDQYQAMSRRTFWMTPLFALLLVAASYLTDADLLGTRASISPTPSVVAASEHSAQTSRQSKAGERCTNLPTLPKLPLAFEENCGQAASDFDYIVRGGSFSMGLSPLGAQLQLNGGPQGRATVTMRLVDTSGEARCLPEAPLPGYVNDLRGPSTTDWVPGIATWERVRYYDVWPGIDLLYYGVGGTGNTGGALEYDFIVGVGSDPTAIQLAFEGADNISLAHTGDLVLETGTGNIIQHAPVMYQETNTGTTSVPGAWKLDEGGALSFAVGPYDTTRPLIIDPVIAYTWSLGGGGLDQVHTAALDASGNLYFAGETSSADFPTRPILTPPYQDSFSGGSTDAFLCKLSEDGSEVLFSTFFGGTGSDSIRALALAGDGSLVMAGVTDSSDLPTLSSDPLGTPFQTALAGSTDGFVATLSADGTTLVQATYLGGSEADDLRAVAVDENDVVYVTGNTVSDDFPTQAASQATRAGGQDAIVAALTADLSGLVYATYDGTALEDEARAMILDAAGYAAVTGYHEDAAKGREAFVRRVTTGGAFLTHASFGGQGDDEGNAIALDLDGNLCIAGTTTSTDFPLETPVYYQLWGGSDAFMTCLDPDTSTLLFSSYCGGLGDESGRAIAAHGDMLTILADSDSIAMNLGANEPFYWNQGGQDALLVSIDRSDPALPSIGFATFFGGSATDSAAALAVDDFGTLHLVGNTNSADFPTTDSLFGSPSTDSIFAAQIVTSPLEHGQIVFHDPYYSTPPDATKRIRVDRLQGTEGEATVEYTTVDFIAWHDVHYVPTTGTLTFAEGQSVAYFDVELLPTSDDELDVVLILRLYDATGGAMLSDPWEAELRIHNTPPLDGGQVLACPAGVVASGTWLAPTLDDARALRDNYLMPHPLGRAIVGAYYTTTRPITEHLIANKGARVMARCLLAPALLGLRYPVLSLLLLCLATGIIGWRMTSRNKPVPLRQRSAQTMKVKARRTSK